MSLQIDIEDREPLDMDQRFSLKLKSGRRKHPDQVSYFIIGCNDKDYYIAFNEDWSSGEGTRTHVWIKRHSNLLVISDLFRFIKQEKLRLPYRTWSLVLLEVYESVDRYRVDYDNVGYEIELLIGEKLSRTLVRQLYIWVNKILEIFVPNLNMTALFACFEKGGGLDDCEHPRNGAHAESSLTHENSLQIL